MTAKPEGLALLREAFPPNQINKLPKQMKKDDQDKGRCEQGSRYSADNVFCGGWHARSLHLDFVGHAALTARLLDADPEWSWEPVAFGSDGLPAFDRNGGLWLRLTICGVTRLGYGDAQGKTGPNAVKEAIGDGLRNAGMRFGAALDLWHKGDLHADQEPADKPAERIQQTPPDDPWMGPPVADPKWAAHLRERVEACTSLPILKGLYSELVSEVNAGHVADTDAADLKALLEQKADALKSEPAEAVAS